MERSQRTESDTVIKKKLYREKPIAHLDYETDTLRVYLTCLQDGQYIQFKVPLSEMGENPFKEEEPAQLLIRWMV